MPPRIPIRLSGDALSRTNAPSAQRRSAIGLRPFTCHSCLSQQKQQQQQQQQDPRASYAADLQSSTPPSDYGGRSPVPQRRLARWSETPAAMRAPFSVRKNDPSNRFAVNEDPERLDRAWDAVFGDGGRDLVPAEIKWLAVTHKSFDQGRRGYNDRLAFVGRRIVDLQTSLAIMAQATATTTSAAATTGASVEGGNNEAGVEGAKAKAKVDGMGREYFQHPVMDILEKLSPEAKREYGDSRRMALAARDFGLPGVVRWKPRRAADLAGSGQEATLVQALYAMIGALALQRGGDVAIKAVRSRILPRLGLKV